MPLCAIREGSYPADSQKMDLPDASFTHVLSNFVYFLTAAPLDALKGAALGP